ncbi:MAG: hypothetical protein ACFFCP_10640 [Promethearchaeota archaeon]
MNGRDLLLILTHLFRKKGTPVGINDAVEFLSFKCRYGSPSQVRRVLSIGIGTEMISRHGDSINAEFLFDCQILSPNLVDMMQKSLKTKMDAEPLS